MPKFSYQLRPAKHIERLLFVEICRRLARVAQLSKYQYFGFGGLEFIDFDLLHRTLGIATMISIEREAELVARYEFNKPFAGITIKAGPASDHLPTLDWKGLRIVWLDYESLLVDEVIRDVETVLRNLTAGSLLMVTINAHMTGAGKLVRLTENVGANRVPGDVTDADLGGKWGAAAAQFRILTEAAMTIVTQRLDGTSLRQLLNFHYADNARMQTLGWVVSSAGTEQLLDECRFTDLDFVRTDGAAFEIRVPVLTAKEIQALNSRLPRRGKQRRLKWLSKQDQEDYASLYRYYPSPGA